MAGKAEERLSQQKVASPFRALGERLSRAAKESELFQLTREQLRDAGISFGVLLSAFLTPRDEWTVDQWRRWAVHLEKSICDRANQRLGHPRKRGRPSHWSKEDRAKLLTDIENIQSGHGIVGKGSDHQAVERYVRLYVPDLSTRIPTELKKEVKNQLTKARKEAGRLTRKSPKKWAF